MPKTNAERQATYRRKRKIGKLKRIEVTLPLEDAIKLDFLQDHWKCSKTEVIRRVLTAAWQEAGEPTNCEPLPDNGQVDMFGKAGE